MPVNVKLLKKVRKLIAEEPRRLRMTKWAQKVNSDNPDSPPCGTVACLAGWTVFAARPMQRLMLKLRRAGYERTGTLFMSTDNFPNEAAGLLGIPLSECPFWQTKWKAPEVLAWIDRQIDAASK